MVSHRHYHQQTTALSTVLHLSLPGMPPFPSDHPLTCISHITPNSPAPAAAVLRVQSTHPLPSCLTNPSSCHRKGSWDSTPLTSLSFDSLQPVPQLKGMEALSSTLRFSGATLPEHKELPGGSGNTHCVFFAASPIDTHPGSLSFPSLMVPSSDTSLSVISRKRNGPKGVRLRPLPDPTVQSCHTTVTVSVIQRRQNPERIRCVQGHTARKCPGLNSASLAPGGQSGMGLGRVGEGNRPPLQLVPKYR